MDKFAQIDIGYCLFQSSVQGFVAWFDYVNHRELIHAIKEVYRGGLAEPSIICVSFIFATVVLQYIKLTQKLHDFSFVPHFDEIFPPASSLSCNEGRQMRCLQNLWPNAALHLLGTIQLKT